MFSGSKKPYTAITVQIDRLTSEQYEEDDIAGIFDLVEVIRIQASGPTEAARAIRKKLKYGNAHRQIRALVLLDGLIQNAGSRFQRAFADEPLLERLRLLARDDVVDAQVRQRCRVLFTQWATEYKDVVGLSGIANLYKELPKSKRPAAARQKVLRETEPTSLSSRARASSSAQSPATSSAPSRPVTLTPTSSAYSNVKLSKSKKSGKPFNLAKEKENMTNCIARASIASTNLLNGLQLVNREQERVSQNPEVLNRFEICKTLRRQILVYIQQVESDDWIGSLVNANDELVKALTAYEIMDRSIDDDSDSDAWEEARSSSNDVRKDLAELSIQPTSPAKPPRPGNIAMPPPIPAKAAETDSDSDSEEDDDDDAENPFGDSHAANTPNNELRGMTWKEV